MNESYNTLEAKLVGIHSHQPVVYMRKGCHICQSEGYGSLVRLQISHKIKEIIAELHLVENEFLIRGSIGLNIKAARMLGAANSWCHRDNHWFNLS